MIRNQIASTYLQHSSIFIYYYYEILCPSYWRRVDNFHQWWFLLMYSVKRLYLQYYLHLFRDKTEVWKTRSATPCIRSKSNTFSLENKNLLNRYIHSNILKRDAATFRKDSGYHNSVRFCCFWYFNQQRLFSWKSSCEPTMEIFYANKIST